ncbi:hypothetical protein JRQ81_005199, partial [Phrynocephalus forsythii]
ESRRNSNLFIVSRYQEELVLLYLPPDFTSQRKYVCTASYQSINQPLLTYKKSKHHSFSADLK